MILEAPRPKLGAFWRDLAPVHMGAGLVALLFAASGPVAIILSVGARGGLSEADLASWIFGAFAINGALSIVFCLAYRQPLVFFWTIPGAVLVGQALDHLSFAQVIGAYYVTGLAIVALGLSGWARRAMALLPMPIVMAMVAGVFLRFGLDWIGAFRDGFWIAAPMTAAFLAVTAIPALSRRLPPLIAALAVGVLAIVALDAFTPMAALSTVIARPNLYAPEFSWQAMVELVVPLTITVLVIQNSQGMVILRAANHEAPLNAIAVGCGLASLLTAVVGSVSTCLTGPANAIIAAGGKTERQYTAGVVTGVGAIIFGALAPLVTKLMLATPFAFIATLAGVAMLSVLRTAFATAFGGRFSLGALVAFLVTVAAIPIASIGAPFWGLVFGFATSAILERDDFRGPAG